MRVRQGDNELALGDLLSKIDRLVSSSTIIEKFGASPRYYDEPLVYQYHAKLVDTTKISDAEITAGYGGCASFNQERAKIKAACEAVERYCLAVYRLKALEKSTLYKLNGRVLDLREISWLDRKARQPNFVWDNNTDFYWVKGQELISKKEIYLPAQMVFVPYTFKNEKVISLPISTGAACGTGITGALFRGIFEIVERDAFMVHYLGKMWGELVELEGIDEFEDMKSYFRRYRLELYLIYLPTDLNFHTFLCLLIDRTGVGPAVSAGLKSGLDPLETARGSIEESWHSRPWIRESLNAGIDVAEIAHRSKSLRDIKERGLYWSQQKMVRHIKPWFNRKPNIRLKNLRHLSKSRLEVDVQYVLNELTKKGHKVYFTDITRPEVKKFGFVTVKALIPSLQPLFLDEVHAYCSRRRLREVAFHVGFSKNLDQDLTINTVPHFFL